MLQTGSSPFLPKNKAATKFEHLSQLVLVDILASLPMEHVVRMARLGHERLRQTCSLKWVTQRMTDVTFMAMFEASLEGGEVATAFCTESVMKRLNGTIEVVNSDFTDGNCLDAYIELATQVPGRLLLCLQIDEHYEDCNQCESFITTMKKLTNLTYVLANMFVLDGYSDFIDKSPNMIFEYQYYIDKSKDFQAIAYWPTLTNGRNIVDVLRAVCGPTVFEETKVEDSRKQATENAFEIEGSKLWKTLIFC